jgi:hypothetical protein
MTPAQFLDIVIPKWQQSLPPKYTPALIARFVASRRTDLEGMVGEAFALRRAQQGKAPRDAAEWVAYGSLVGPGRERDAEPDAKIIRRIQSRMEKLELQLGQDADARTTAWSMAVEFAAGRADEGLAHRGQPPGDAARPGQGARRAHGRGSQVLAQYSGWGGLSIESVKAMLPADLVPESFGLIHEYYTPTVIAEAIAELLCPLLPELAGNDGIVRALEPSAGIGRLIRAFSPRRCLALEVGGQIKKIAWTAVEFSKVSSTLLRALRPDVDLFHMPMERWIREEGPRFQGDDQPRRRQPALRRARRHGARGPGSRLQGEARLRLLHAPRARPARARRGRRLPRPRGVPERQPQPRAAREAPAAASPARRLPHPEPRPQGARHRPGRVGRHGPGDLAQPRRRADRHRPADEFIADGDYFKTFPTHILGKEDGSFSGDDEAAPPEAGAIR